MTVSVFFFFLNINLFSFIQYCKTFHFFNQRLIDLASFLKNWESWVVAYVCMEVAYVVWRWPMSYGGGLCRMEVTYVVWRWRDLTMWRGDRVSQVTCHFPWKYLGLTTLDTSINACFSNLINFDLLSHVCWKSSNWFDIASVTSNPIELEQFAI